MYVVVAYETSLGVCEKWEFQTRKDAEKCVEVMNSIGGSCGAYIKEEV